MSSNAETGRRTLAGRHVLLLLIAFFLLIFAANGALVYAAVKSWTGLESNSAYRDGQLYNGEIARAKAQAALGWRVSVHVERAADGAARLHVEARDAGGAPLRLPAAEARLERPTARQADRSMTLAEREPGVYEAVLDEVAKGQWDLMLALADGRNSYRSRNRVVLR